MVVIMAVAVVFAVGVIVALGISDSVGQREAVMRGKEIDAAAIGTENVGRSGDARDQRADGSVAPPETAHVVAEAVVPFEPVRREIAKLIATRADVPRLGDHDPVSEQRVGGDLGKDGCIGVDSRGYAP